MNIYDFGKKSARLCVSTLMMMSVLFLPVQAAEIVPLPVSKPTIINGSIVPQPTKKPEYHREIKSDNEQGVVFKSMSLKLASLFSVKDIDDSQNADIYGYQPLSSEQAKIYAGIFKAQALGDMIAADILLTKISDNRLAGHVQYQRYMHASYKTSFTELQNWLAQYSDHPGADNIYRLAKARRGSVSLNEIVKPANGRVLSQVSEPTIYYPKHYKSKSARSKVERKSVAKLSRKVRAFVRRGKPLDALKYFRDSSAREFMDNVESDILLTKIAAGFLYRGNTASAYKLSSKSVDRSGLRVPEASWIAGLSLWKRGDFAQAATYFEQAGASKYSSGWLSSAGSYWAARSYKRANNKVKFASSLNKASKHSRTFYGIMALHALGKDLSFDWGVPEYADNHEELILSKAAGRRAYSLVAAGQYDLAESELLRLKYKGDDSLRRAALSYASHVGLPGIALRLGNMVERADGKYYDSAIYPVSPWSPKDGYNLDPALVHAVIRQESRFNLQAKSHSGAVGLMQIMPKTAQYVAKTNKYSEKLTPSKLRLPEMNMKIGQDYLEYLLKGRYVKGNVVSLLVSYNAGPGNLLKWQARMGDSDDQLLFIETLPVQETRDYVERVLSNYWIYRNRAGLDLPSLAALSKGKTPKYTHIMQATYPYKLAAN